MLSTTSIRKLLCVAAMTFAFASTAGATDVILARSFISNAGSDNNASTTGCAVTAPCRTLAGAYPATESGGEIVMMNPGGYGCVTITTPISIIGVDGSTSTTSNGACIVITVPGNGNVLIRNLEITGVNVPGTVGVQLNSGQLTLLDAHLKMLGTAVLVGNNSATAHADIIDGDIIGNTIGIESNGAGVNTCCSNPPYVGTKTLVRLNGGSMINNTTALQMTNAATDTNGNCENTFWGFTMNGFPNVNLAGFTNFLTSNVTNCTLQTYYSNASQPAPN
jgi:hypothetical protein